MNLEKNIPNLQGVPVLIDRKIMSLIAKAHRHVEIGQKIGNVVITAEWRGEMTWTSYF